MVNGNDLIEFEEKHYDELIEAFLEKSKERWDAFVLEQYYNQGGN